MPISMPPAAKEWPIRHWVAHDFIVGCPDIAVVDTREGVVNYVGVLSASDPAFARAWSRYRQIAAFDGLVVYRRAASGMHRSLGGGGSGALAAPVPHPPDRAHEIAMTDSPYLFLGLRIRCARSLTG